MTGFERAIVGGVAGLLYGAVLLVISIVGGHLDYLASRHCYIEEFTDRGRAIWQCELGHEDFAGLSDRSNVDPLMLSAAPFGLVDVVRYWLDRSWYDFVTLHGRIMYLCGPPLMWATIGLLVAQSDRGKSLRLAQVLVVLHYISALALVATTGTGLRGLAGKVPIHVLMWAMFYLAGQIVLWRRMVRRGQVRRGE